MKTSRRNFIDNLTTELTPVNAVNTRVSAMYWFASAFALAIIIFSLTGPFRSGAVDSLLSSPQFFIETVIGLIAVITLIYTAFEMAIPAPRSKIRILAWPVLILVGWISLYLFGLSHPALEPSMLGKREFCYVETFLYSVPALLLGLLWVKKQWPTEPVIAGALVGVAAGVVPAMVMQFACMYEPMHILTEHILPGLSVGLVGALLAFIMLKLR
ncbi:hypothetical protein A9Q78_10105 [Methylophaga sp. 41_12_T18]|nr:hypothetical protein A9Q78_10105 [Methylophaga sp. 41_12_T18]